MEAEIVLRIITGPAQNLIHLRSPPRGHTNSRSDGAAIGARSDALDDQPVVPVAAVIPEQRRRGIDVVDDDIDVAVIVDVAEGTTPADSRGENTRSRFRGYIFEAPVAEIAIKEFLLL